MKKYNVLSAGCSLWRAGSISFRLDVFHGGLGNNVLQLVIKNYDFFSTSKLLQFLVTKSLDSDLDPDPL